MQRNDFLIAHKFVLVRKHNVFAEESNTCILLRTAINLKEVPHKNAKALADVDDVH